MVVFPNAKINIGLNILNKRQDGYHNLQTTYYPVPLTDVLEIIIADAQKEDLQFSSSGIHVGTETKNNLSARAFRLLKKDFPQMPALKMHLHKAIPMGAGLGGGSADAAFTLILLNDRFNLGLSAAQLSDYALQLGSDCPFFIYNKPCIASGRGEILSAVEINLSAYHMIVINPGIHVSTSLAFSHISPSADAAPLPRLLEAPIHTWKDNISNDFELPVFKVYPEISTIKQTLYEAGALYASMSGSGSSVYGIFEKHIKPELQLPLHYYQKWIQ